MEHKLDQCQIDYIIRTKYAHLSAKNFETYWATCEELGLSPLLGNVHPYIGTDTVTGEQTMELYTKIEGLRTIAEHTGEYDHQGAPEWCGDDGVWVDRWNDRNGPPAHARVTVYRVGREPSTGYASWDECVQFDRDGNWDTYWKKMPAHMLLKCASANAFRLAFPETLGGLKVFGERRGKPKVAAPPGAPMEIFQFHMKLIELGLKDTAERSQRIEAYKQRHRRLYNEDRQQFYAAMVEDVRESQACTSG